MTGHECPWTEQIALYAGGDLTAAEAATVEEHIAACASCGLLLEELQADRLLLSAEPDIPETTFDVVRSSVLSRSRGAGGANWLRIAAGVLIALLGAGLWIALKRNPQPVPETAVVS